MSQRAWRLALLLAAVPVSAAAQLSPIGVPRGLLRLDLGGEFENYNHEFLDGRVEDYPADFSHAQTGSNLFPSLAGADLTVGQLIGQSGYRLNLGRSTAVAEVNVGTGSIGLAYGLTRRITLLANLPIVRARVQPRFLFDSGSGDAGRNPANATQFLAQFQDAIDTLNARIAAGAYGPSLIGTAVAARDSALLLQGRLSDLATNAAFIPTDSSTAGRLIATRIDGLRDTLTKVLSIPGFTLGMPLATQRLSPAEFSDQLNGLLASDSVRAFPVRETRVFLMGDLELGAAYALVDHWDRTGRPGGLRAAVRGLVRFPTGRTDRQDDFFDLGTGQGHLDLDLGLTADVGGRRWGARLTGGYTRRFSRFRVRRITPPTQPIANLSRLANLSIDPGDEVSLGLRPFYRLAPAIALHLGVQYSRRGSDRVSYRSAGDSIPGVNAGDLALDSKAAATVVSGGVSYASASLSDESQKGLPVEATWTYAAVVGASGGRVPQARTTRIELRFYSRLFRHRR
ncbi:MAG: hypothetical protein ACREMO_13355 [Gemmatimonadales bacterium]